VPPLVEPLFPPEAPLPLVAPPVVLEDPPVSPELLPAAPPDPLPAPVPVGPPSASDASLLLKGSHARSASATVE
jgi:hypothetical protein